MTIFKKYLVVSLVAVGVLVAYTVLATSKDDIVFPIAELQNCQDEQECKAYCDDPSHLNECLAFAEQHNLFSEREIEKARKFQEIGAVGPGGCTSEFECENYCENISNIDECLAFAEEHGFMEEHELDEARKIQQALAGGAQLPGGCTSRESCEAYCEDLNNMRECIAFAEEAGFMSPEELREVQQVLKALDAGVPFPGDCRGEDECEIYCEDPNHIEECVEFGIAAGFIPPEEAEEIRRILPLMKEGKMPGGCREREECEAYCSDDAHVEECTIFFVDAGFMSQEEARMFRETGGRGPGGCSGREECEAFCNDPSNQEACFEFGRDHGFISEEEFHSIEQGSKQFEVGFATAPPEVEQCLKEKLSEDVLLKIEAGTFLPTPELGEHMRGCFEDFFPGPEGGEFGPPPGFEGGEGEFFPSDFNRERGEFIPEEFRDFLPEGAENLLPHEIEELIRQEQFQRQFEEQDHDGFLDQFQREFVPQEGFDGVPSDFPDGQDGFLDQFQQLIPQFLDEEQGNFIPEDFLRIEQQEEEAFRLRLEQELQHELEQLQQQEPPVTEATTQGSILEAAGRFLQELLGR